MNIKKSNYAALKLEGSFIKHNSSFFIKHINCGYIIAMPYSKLIPILIDRIRVERKKRNDGIRLKPLEINFSPV